MLAGSNTSGEWMRVSETGMMWWTCVAGTPQASQYGPRSAMTALTTR